MGLIEGKVAIVTGAGAGLGRSYAKALAAEGAALVVNDFSAEAAEDTVREIVGTGGKAVTNVADVGDVAGGASLLQTALEAFGRVDILVNNAGILRDTSFVKMDLSQWNAIMHVHLQALFASTQPVFTWMKESGDGGVIVNTTSTAGIRGNFGQTNYGAAKMGIVGFSHVAAIEGAKANVKVNVIAPAARTRMTEQLLGPMAEKLAPELVTPVVAYLAHESCEVSGETYSCGGGRVGRVFVGVVPGYYTPQLSVEDVRDNLAAIRDTSTFVIPSNAMEEIGLLMKVSAGK